MSPLRELRFLSSSENRPTALRRFWEDGPLDRRELEEGLNASRRTVKRTVEALADREYLQRFNGGYRLSAFGRAVVKAYDQFEQRVALADRFRPFLANVPGEAFDLDVDHLADAELLVAEETSPFVLLNRALDLRASATRVRELVPSVDQKSVQQLAERVRSGEDLDFELVLTEEAATTVENRAYSDDHARNERSEQVDLFAHPGPFPMFVGTMDGTTLLGAMKAGRPHAMVISEDRDVHRWASERIDQYRREATPLTAPGAETGDD